MTLAKGSDLGADDFLLLQDHAPRLEVANLGHHGALHDCSALIILDESHPARFLERDLLGEALFLEIANGIIVGVRQEVHHIRRRLDIVLSS